MNAGLYHKIENKWVTQHRDLYGKLAFTITTFFYHLIIRNYSHSRINVRTKAEQEFLDIKRSWFFKNKILNYKLCLIAVVLNFFLMQQLQLNV